LSVELAMAKQKIVERRLSERQIEKGSVILAAFVVLRAAMAGFGQGVQHNLQSALFLIVTFLVMSLGLVYLGFSRWVKVDLRAWWRFDRKRILGDIGWGVLGFVIASVLAFMVMASIMILGFVPEGVQRTETLPYSQGEFILTLFLGLTTTGFQEETIFRGFLQDVLTERFGKWEGNILQAAVFSLAHIGYYPLKAWPMFLLAFMLGIAFGWLKMKRGTLIAPWIAHGFFS